MQKTVIIGITSGIAAYKSLDLITLLKQADSDVFVVMTKNAANVVDPHEIERLSGNPVAVELFEKDFDYKKILQTRTVDHIALSDKADCMVVVPATANVIAKLAYGIADDYLTTTALAMTKPIIICPAMNVNMWNNPITQENLNKLRQLGYQIINPTKGMLACGYEGVGRLENIEIIKQEILQMLQQTTSLKGKKVIVTAGGTIEKIDDVRFIANRSSGKMGIAIAEECFKRGAEVLLLRAKHSVSPRYVMQEEIFSSAKELQTLLQSSVKQYDYLYHTAAVADFTIEQKIEGKISSDQEAMIKLIPQAKIIDEIKELNPQIKLIAFKAEHALSEQALIEKAKDKLESSQADVVVANDISKEDRGFESDMNEVYLVTKNQTKHIPHSSKNHIAKEIIDFAN